MPRPKRKGRQLFLYKGVLAKPLPFDPHWASIRRFTALRALAMLNAVAAQMPEPAPLRGPGGDDVPPNRFAPRFFPPDLEERIAALYSAHGVDYGDDDALLFALAIVHVPGLSVEHAPHGPAQIWTPRRRAELKVAVDEHIADKRSHSRRITVAAACMHLAGTEPWRSLLRTTKNPRLALRKQYDLAEDTWVGLVKYQRWANAHPEEEAALRQRDRQPRE